MTDNKDPKQNVEWSFEVTPENLLKGFTQVFEAFAGDQAFKEETFTEPLDGIQRASIEVDFSLGVAHLSGGAGDGLLVDADLSYVGDMQFEIETDEGSKSIKLSQRNPSDVIAPIQQGFRAMANNEKLNWTVKLAESIPLDLKIHAGLGEAHVDLTGLTLDTLDVRGGVGELALTLPAQDEQLVMRLHGGVGELTVTVPENSSSSLTIEGGVGQTNIRVPENAPVSVRVKMGLGHVQVADSFEKEQKREDFIGGDAIWQTAGYDLAERRVDIVYNGGVGELRVETYTPAAD